MFHQSIRKEHTLNAFSGFGLGFFVYYTLPLPYYFHTSSEDLLLVCGTPFDHIPSVKDVSRSSLQKAVNTTSVLCPRQASQASILKSGQVLCDSLKATGCTIVV